MKTVSLLLAFLFTFAASAAPAARISIQPCAQTSFDKNLGELIQNVNIILQDDGNGNFVDPRHLITEMHPSVDLSPAEIAQIRKTTGYVFCPGTKYGNPKSASGTLVGQGSQIMTNVHVFKDEYGRLREPLSECYFQNQAVPADKIPLDFTEEKFYKFKTSEPIKEWWNDLAYVKLTKKIPGAKPIPIDTSGADTYEGQKITMISATQERLNFETDGRVPIAQSCFVKVPYRSSRIQAAGFHSNCTANENASGGANYIRIEGKLALKGITRGGGPKEADFTPFNIKKKSYAYSIEVDARIADEVVAFESQLGTQTASRESNRGF